MLVLAGWLRLLYIACYCTCYTCVVYLRVSYRYVARRLCSLEGESSCCVRISATKTLKHIAHTATLSIIQHIVRHY